MDSRKTSKKSNKTAEISVAPPNEAASADSKPVKRTPAAKRTSAGKSKTTESATAKPAAPKKTSHRHSKLAVPPAVAPVITVMSHEVVATAPVLIDEAAPKIPELNQEVSLAALNYDDVARLAYKYWEDRNRANGFSVEDWLRAEKALSTK